MTKRDCDNCGKTYAHRPPGTHIANDGRGGDTRYIWLGRVRLATATCICEGYEVATKKIAEMRDAAAQQALELERARKGCGNCSGDQLCAYPECMPPNYIVNRRRRCPVERKVRPC